MFRFYTVQFISVTGRGYAPAHEQAQVSMAVCLSVCLLSGCHGNLIVGGVHPARKCQLKRKRGLAIQ